jgi:hydroxyethylthiazole kinase
LLASIGALAVYGIAGEMAAEGDPGPGSFRTRLIDALDDITPERVRQQARLVVA